MDIEYKYFAHEAVAHRLTLREPMIYRLIDHQRRQYEEEQLFHDVKFLSYHRRFLKVDEIQAC